MDDAPVSVPLDHALWLVVVCHRRRSSLVGVQRIERGCNGMICGVIFDLDGTLADSRLDFDAMRREMELPEKLPILEALVRLPPQQAERCQQILHRHELAGAQRATVLPGAIELLEALKTRGIH